MKFAWRLEAHIQVSVGHHEFNLASTLSQTRLPDMLTLEQQVSPVTHMSRSKLPPKTWVACVAWQLHVSFALQGCCKCVCVFVYVATAAPDQASVSVL